MNAVTRIMIHAEIKVSDRELYIVHYFVAVGSVSEEHIIMYGTISKKP